MVCKKLEPISEEEWNKLDTIYQLCYNQFRIDIHYECGWLYIYPDEDNILEQNIELYGKNEARKMFYKDIQKVIDDCIIGSPKYQGECIVDENYDGVPERLMVVFGKQLYKYLQLVADNWHGFE